ncbi:MAG: 16S rRNA (adenine(1518)-N(6)/adenine(1519)-N(6))-dimethyltransferase RsmA [Dehalococcoidia bacterium]|nr:MAG: 16S rRNA (adenine(1518)-N(6)/adenine(1519)-N(6))-dimethyltransferase RsmA [Dehalococcoidia bacterium]
MQTTRRLLAHLDTRAKKSLGQNFLIDSGILRKIVEAADLSSQDVVIEVGPGLGVLTAELAKRAGRVIAVELDDHLSVLLKQTLSWATNLTVVHEDVLKIKPSALLAKAGLQMGSAYKVVANLPYYITSAVLRHFLEGDARPGVMVVMVQKEVARAITAAPGEMSLLSVAVQFYGQARIVSSVSAHSFYPAPKVDSAILKIHLYPKPFIGTARTDGFFALVRAGFCANRKQLVNSLSQGLSLPKEEIRPLLEKAGIEPRRRAETLAIPEWVKLWEVFDIKAKQC